jgi:DMSO reductase anchor subunit
MCHQRLSEGEAPACVQACPTEAIRIVKVKSQGAGDRSREINLFPTAIHNPQSTIPDSSITLPTTRYVGRAVPDSAHAADRAALVPQHAHWPLVFMLALTQCSIGILLVSSSHTLTLTAAGIFYLGMAASVLHLGQPLKAWRFFLGLKTSWLSREILAFSLFAPIPFLLCSLPYLPNFPLKNLSSLLIEYSAWPLGIAAIFTSVMIYHDTHRALWRFRRSALRFYGSTASCAALGILINNPASLLSLGIFASVVIIKLLAEIHFLRHAQAIEWSPDQHSARLQSGPLRKILIARIALALTGIATSIIQPWLGLPILVAAEILERQLYFQSVQAPKMPGSFGSAIH